MRKPMLLKGQGWDGTAGYYVSKVVLTFLFSLFSAGKFGRSWCIIQPHQRSSSFSLKRWKVQERTQAPGKIIDTSQLSINLTQLITHIGLRLGLHVMSLARGGGEHLGIFWVGMYRQGLQICTPF